MSLSPPSVTPSSSHTVTMTVDNQHQWQRQSGNNQLKVTGDERAVVNAVIEACQNALSEMTVEGRVAVPSAGSDVFAQGDGGSLEWINCVRWCKSWNGRRWSGCSCT